MRKKCPTCGSSDDVRKILWGMPAEEPDYAKYVIGGCLISEDMPDYKCLKCSTEFFKNKNEWRNRFIWDSLDGISIKCKKCEEWLPASLEASKHKCSILKKPQAKDLGH